jgi:hypothetical protein
MSAAPYTKTYPVTPIARTVVEHLLRLRDTARLAPSWRILAHVIKMAALISIGHAALRNPMQQHAIPYRLNNLMSKQCAVVVVR